MPSPHPHDLLWGLSPQALPEDAPAWAREVLASGQPVVVRRAVCAPGRVPVGLRGAARSQRLALEMASVDIRRILRPEVLRMRDCAGLPALQVLVTVAPLLDATGLAWGPTGGVGYQLATGVPVVHAASDLDLVLRAPTLLDRSDARRLLTALQGAACRIDLQLETPHGAIALREWAGEARQVLLKSSSGPCLVSNPWQAAECAA